MAVLVVAMRVTQLTLNDLEVTLSKVLSIVQLLGHKLTFDKAGL